VGGCLGLGGCGVVGLRGEQCAGREAGLGSIGVIVIHINNRMKITKSQTKDG